MRPSDLELAGLLDAVIERRPDVDTARLTTALEALCRARDAIADPIERERISLLVTLVMGVKHPIDAPPWDALVQARAGALLQAPPKGSRPSETAG